VALHSGTVWLLLLLLFLMFLLLLPLPSELARLWLRMRGLFRQGCCCTRVCAECDEKKEEGERRAV